MKYLSRAPLVLVLHASFCVTTHLSAANIQAVPRNHDVPATVAIWTSTKAEHVYGFPDIKPNKKGTLTLSADALTFSGKSGNTFIPRSSVTAVSAGNQRVEIWGVGGRLLRMTIPDGGGDHAAVFFLPANEADRALQNFVLIPLPPRKVSDIVCQNASVEPKSVLVSAPNWDQAEVPAAYRALVYEHLIDRIQTTKEVAHVYRGGEGDGQGTCPQYTVHISIATFKEGSSVKRAFLGPAGMFVGTTQMKFDVTFTDSSGKLNTSEQITATIRGESESTNVADRVAKSIAKHYATALKNADKSNAAKNTVNPAS